MLTVHKPFGLHAFFFFFTKNIERNCKEICRICRKCICTEIDKQFICMKHLYKKHGSVFVGAYNTMESKSDYIVLQISGG